ncbi:hypothetical protein PS6_010589 [Mucor atramentarius]
MNIQTLTSPKSYSSSNSNGRNYLNACPSDDAGLLRYSSSPPATSSSSPAAVPRYSYHRESTSPSPSSTSTDLQSVVSKYHANPELLKLILASKVEEDKRRTEEAKLKAKELDLYFKNQQDHFKSNRNHQQEAFILQQRRRRSSSSSNSSTNSNSNNNAGESIHRRIAPYAIPRPIVMSPPSRRNSSASALLSINQLSINSSNTPSLSTSAPANTNLFPPPTTSLSYNSRPQEPVQKISRRRRSMQAITKIVETTEFPYDDRHFWKNNGNTVQKKTGCKSVYYKCANSCKGCPVNKTVVEQPDGSYIIKYRGDHISECSQVEHIRDLFSGSTLEPSSEPVILYESQYYEKGAGRAIHIQLVPTRPTAPLKRESKPPHIVIPAPNFDEMRIEDNEFSAWSYEEDESAQATFWDPIPTSSSSSSSN